MTAVSFAHASTKKRQQGSDCAMTACLSFKGYGANEGPPHVMTQQGTNEPLFPLLLVWVSVSHLSAVSCKEHLVFEGLGRARTSLVAYNTMHGTCLKQLSAQASNDGITSVSAAHPGHGVSPRSLRPRRQTPAPAAITAPCRICLGWNACRRSSRNSSGLCE